MPNRQSFLGLEVPDAVVLAALSLLGTAAAFVFEMGYCTFHGVPWTLIVFTTPRIVAFSVSFAVMAIYCGLYIRTALMLCDEKSKGARIFGQALIIVAIIAMAVFFAGSINANHIFVAFAIVNLIIYSGLEITSPDSEKKVDLRGAMTQLMGNPRRLSIFAVAAIMLFFMFGVRQASIFERQYVDAERPERALVAVYGENWIFRMADPVAGRFLDEIQVVRADKVENIRLIRPKVALIEPNRLDIDKAQSDKFGEPVGATDQQSLDDGQSTPDGPRTAPDAPNGTSASVAADDPNKNVKQGPAPD